MKKFVFVYYGGGKHEGLEKEEMQKIMDAWMAWFGTFKDKMVDGGNPFAKGGQEVSAKEVKAIADDMYPARGYTIINAKDMDEAVSVAKGCPSLSEEPAGFVRVYEAMPM